MPSAPPNVSARGLSIAIDGSDVYLAGWQKTSSASTAPAVAKYWKNGVATDLTNGSYYAIATCVRVFGSDVYIAGREYNSAGNGVVKYWKNGVPTNITDGTHDAEEYSIFLQ